MREIKFRVWNPETNKMEMVGALDWCGDYEIITCNTETSKLYKYGHKELDFVLMQYVGLKDKNGLEIYEGDIIDVKYTQINPRTKIKIPFHNICTVKWLEKSACFGYIADGSNIFNDFRYKASEGFIYEVIGNIYESEDKNE